MKTESTTATLEKNKSTPIDSSPKTAVSSHVDGGSFLGHIWASIGATLVLGIICCGLYPLAVYWLGQLIFPIQANGSLVTKDGTLTTDDSKAVGSYLIAQNFSVPGYFHERPSAANNAAGNAYTIGGGYDATSSGGTNFGPLSDELINGLTGAPAPTPAPATATAPATTTDASTQTAATSASTQVASSQAASAPASQAASAPSTQPAPIVYYDGIRLRCIHYAVDNGIAFKLYNVTYDKDDNITDRKEVPIAKFTNADGSLNDVALITAFPHNDPAGNTVLVAADFATLIPADAVTASGSGLDPHISPENAALQAQRVADARKISKDKVLELIKQNTDQPSLGFLGDPGINVLMLNIALDKVAPIPAPATTTAPTTATATEAATSPATTSAPAAK